MRKQTGLTAAIAAALLISAGAKAADMPVRPAYVAPVFSWTGFYLGGNIGGAWARRDVDESRFGLSFGRSSDGVFIGGGQAGFNYQMGWFVSSQTRKLGKFGACAQFVPAAEQGIDGSIPNNGVTTARRQARLQFRYRAI